MLAGPDLLVILVIALIIFGPKKLPEIGKSIGHAMREFKKASEEMKESFEGEIKEIEEIKNHSTSLDLVADLPEKTSKPLALSDSTKDASLPKEESVSDKTLPLSSVSVGNAGKGKNEKLGGVKDG